VIPNCALEVSDRETVHRSNNLRILLPILHLGDSSRSPHNIMRGAWRERQECCLYRLCRRTTDCENGFAIPLGASTRDMLHPIQGRVWQAVGARPVCIFWLAFAIRGIGEQWLLGYILKPESDFRKPV